MALSAAALLKKLSLLECHRSHYLLLEKQLTNSFLPGDSFIAGLSRYSKVWQRCFSIFSHYILKLEQNEWKMYSGERCIYKILPRWKMWLLYVEPATFPQILLWIWLTALPTVTPVYMKNLVIVSMRFCRVIAIDKSWPANRDLIKDLNILEYSCLKDNFVLQTKVTVQLYKFQF